MNHPTPAPESGQFVRIRNRLAAVRAVEEYTREDRHAPLPLHLVEVEYLDDKTPQMDLVLWNLEPRAEVIGATSLPRVDETPPDHPGALEAFLNAHRWTRLNRLHASPDGALDPLLGVWNSAVQIHPYQLEPVLKALEMPRGSLLLCDGVGLGKTIQCGLVLEELLLRRRIRRILVICPAVLQQQWKYELKRKFNLEFEIIDSGATFQLRRRLGIDTNPWRVSPRVITSMDYLRNRDILDQFKQTAGIHDDAAFSSRSASPHAAWDLLIVDECHNFAPLGVSQASQRTQMLREIRFLFEHRIFLSATPHNGKTISFTGLLELLDPVRFQMTTELDETDKSHLEAVRVRRLKEDINRCSIHPPFADQLPPQELKLALAPAESNLFSALRRYRERGQELLLNITSPTEKWVGQFIFSLLTKRLLSCPFSFARTWWRHLHNVPDTPDQALFSLAKLSMQKAQEELKNDAEKTLAEEDAARHGGSWLRSRRLYDANYVSQVSQALEALGYDEAAVMDDDNITDLATRHSDSKTDALVQWVKQNLFTREGRLRDDEQLIVFTEYKETLRFLEKRFLQEGFNERTMLLLYGGMDNTEFERIQTEFESEDSDARLLLATDAASEGINLQSYCRWVIHYDIPWSPTKIQQRNGRVSRHGQSRDVHIHYFRCDQEEDYDFLLKVAKKVDQVREDLGSVESVFNETLQNYFQGRKPSIAELDQKIHAAQASSTEKRDLHPATKDQIERNQQSATERLQWTNSELRISPPALVNLLQAALKTEGKGQLEEIPNKPGFYRLTPPPGWKALVDATLTEGKTRDRLELVFDENQAISPNDPRRILRLKRHQVLMRLGHPVMRQALAVLNRQLHDPSGKYPIRRWTVKAIQRPHFDGFLAFHYLLTVINERFETVHDQVGSVLFEIRGNDLSPMPDALTREILGEPAGPLLNTTRRDALLDAIKKHWPSHQDRLEAFMKQTEKAVAGDMAARAKAALAKTKKAEAEKYEYRLKELEKSTNPKELEKRLRELHKMEIDLSVGYLFSDWEAEQAGKKQSLEQEIDLLKKDMERTKAELEREKEYRLNELLPKRFTLRPPRILPLAIEYLVPATGEEARS
ncbi:MAG: DISARM system SNF2-like helicase DrmD [bacterium]